MATSGNVVSTNMIAETPFNRAVPDTLVNGSFSGKPEDSDIGLSRNLMEEREAKDDLRWYLMNKYRSILVDRLTAEDLEELRLCQRRCFNSKSGHNREFLRRFVMKLREYVPDEILRYEITGIESLVMLMRAEDLPDRNRAESGAVMKP